MADTGIYRIGVDVGGTNTDAALVSLTAIDTENRGVLASDKASTTPDITSGIEAAIASVIDQSAVDRSRIVSVTIGTTHFVNALVEADARRLAKVAVVRLCSSFTKSLPPFSGFPVGLRRIIEGGAYYLDGGFEIDGRQIKKIDPEQVKKTALQIQAAGIKVVALVGVFSPLDQTGEQEKKAKEIMMEIAPELDVVCSRDVGIPGLLERENATILNATILKTARSTIKAFRRAMIKLQLSCSLYVSQNDGTLIDAEDAAEFPIKTFASGPTNSMTGAAFLAGLDKPVAAAEITGEQEEVPQILVVDIGGTTTDVCALLPSGFPRQAPGFIEVCGVRTVFSMPEVVSIGLGGGSKVFTDPKTGELSVGPASVGHFLTTEALVFGGKTLTASDIVVADGTAELGDKSLVSHVPAETIQTARAKMKKMLEDVIELMKVSAAPVHVLLVGGGSLLVETLDGVEQCTRPVHYGAANAVGAAIAKVSGESDILRFLKDTTEEAIVAEACKEAIDIAVGKGADPADIKIVDINKIPLSYVTEKGINVKVRVVGKLLTPDISTIKPAAAFDGILDEAEEAEGEKVSVPDALEPTNRPSHFVDLTTYKPNVRNGIWYISEVDLEFMEIGVGVLGTGGGGATHHDFLRALEVLRTSEPGKMRVIHTNALKDDDLVCFGSWYGAPSVIGERVAGGEEVTTGIETLKKVVGFDSFDAMYTDEIGGGNGITAFPTATQYDVPVVDGDAMGRAYPTMYHAILYIYGESITPCALTDARGNCNIVMNAENPHRVEGLLRTAAIEMGLGCAVIANPLRGKAIKKLGVPNTISQAWYIGRAVIRSRKAKTSITNAIFDVNPGRVLFTGKIIDVRRDVARGYTMGAVLIAPLSDDDRETQDKKETQDSRHMIIPFQNEYLYAAYSDSTGSQESQEVACTVPDLISILGQDGEAIGSQDLRYGLRVSVIAMPAHPLWKTEKGLKIGGPEGFGLDIPFVGVGEYTDPRSVIEEFGN